LIQADSGESMRIVSKRGMPLRFLLALGLMAVPAPGESPERLVGRADAAMYQAKRAGSNRICLAAKDGGECESSRA